jgi:hypothetical protein
MSDAIAFPVVIPAWNPLCLRLAFLVVIPERNLLLLSPLFSLSHSREESAVRISCHPERSEGSAFGLSGGSSSLQAAEKREQTKASFSPFNSSADPSAASPQFVTPEQYDIP